MLMKDGLIDEEALERERKYQMTQEEKVDTLGKIFFILENVTQT